MEDGHTFRLQFSYLLKIRKVIAKYELVADMPELKKLISEFGKIGNNLNQIARHFNTGGIHSQEMRKAIGKFFKICVNRGYGERNPHQVCWYAEIPKWGFCNTISTSGSQMSSTKSYRKMQKPPVCRSLNTYAVS